jgi:hypothetical protein
MVLALRQYRQHCTYLIYLPGMTLTPEGEMRSSAAENHYGSLVGLCIPQVTL